MLLDYHDDQFTVFFFFFFNSIASLSFGSHVLNLIAVSTGSLSLIPSSTYFDFTLLLLIPVIYKIILPK